MGAIQRNITRSILNASEVTKDLSRPGTEALSFVLTTSDFLYIGFKKPFSTRHFQMGVVNSNSATLSVSYWDGAGWTAVKDLIDQTEGFTRSGFISWVNFTNWEKSFQTPVSDKGLYWVRLSTDADLSAGTTIESLLNLFCDQEMLRRYYPEIVTDSSYLPPGRTNFTEQFVAGTELTYDALKKDALIKDESEIIDINEVSIAAVHASAWVILDWVTRDIEAREAIVDPAWNKFQSALNDTKLDLDYNNDGEISEIEEDTGDFFRARV